jgi:maleate isomerase
MIDEEWLAKLGVLVPSTNNMLERDAHIVLPRTVTAHFSRMKYARADADPLAALSRHAPEAALLLADAQVDVIAFGCTTGSLLGGLGYDLKIISLIEDACGIPTTTTASALIDALHHVGARRIALVTPYVPQLNERVVAFLGANDIAVDGVTAFGISDPGGIPKVTPVEIAEAARTVNSDRVDAVFLSCTALRGIEAIDLLGNELGKPVLSSNQVTYWKLLQLLKSPLRLEGRNTHLLTLDQPTGKPAATRLTAAGS